MNQKTDNLLKNMIQQMKIKQMVKTWKKKAKKSRHRVNILKEWELTQKSYINDLELIIKKIQQPLLGAEIITAEEDRIIFPNIDSMLKLSKELLGDIQGFLNEWNPHTTLIGEKLINFHKYFIIYREYCNNFYKGQAILKKAKKHPMYQAIQAALPMDCESYVIKPVQRPPKYQLLLRQYRKALPPQHADYDILQKAIQKYHDVNEENNQSMDLQIRNQKMVQFDRKYGGIINTTRIYLTQQIAGSIDFKVKLLIFNDLILVLKIINQEKQIEEGYKKIFLDGQSFIQAPMDGKYFVNKIFICGLHENIHIHFTSISQKDRILEMIRRIIQDLHRKQTNRQTLKKRVKSKMTVYKIQDLDVKGRPMVRVLVVGVQKRPTFASNQTYYILKIIAPVPNKQFQYSYLKWDELIALEKQLKSRNKLINLPVLDENPDNLSFYDIKKNKTKIIEYRQIFIERFVNFLFRSEELIHDLTFIVKSLHINPHFWKFLSYHEPCNCDICMNPPIITVSDFQEQKSQIRNFISSRNSFSHSIQDQQRLSTYSKALFQEKCFFNSFITTSHLAQSSNNELDSLSRRLIWLECETGRIDYSILPKEDNFEDEKKVKINISVLSLKNDEQISVLISPQTTVQQVIEEISANYKIETMRDFGLFLDYQEVPRLIDRDEYLLKVLKEAEYQIQKVTEKKQQSESTGFWKRLSSLKRWGQEMIAGKKSKLYIRKYLFLEDQLQLKACQTNPARYTLLVEQVFFRFKNQILILSINDIKKLSACYYILSSMDKLAHLCQTNFRPEKLKKLLPDNKWHLLDSMTFSKDVFMYIQQYGDKMDRMPSRSNSSKIFTKVEIIEEEVLILVNKIIGWNTFFFEVTNYDPPTLPGNCASLLLGINRKNLILIRHKQLTPLIQIPLSTLQYKVTAFSIFIETSERILRFDGRMMYDIKKIIEIYQHLTRKFDNQGPK